MDLPRPHQRDRGWEMKKPMTTDELLEWATGQCLYIEIYGDGSTQIERKDDDDGMYRDLCDGPTLNAALRRAYKKIGGGK